MGKELNHLEIWPAKTGGYTVQSHHGQAEDHEADDYLERTIGEAVGRVRSLLVSEAHRRASSGLAGFHREHGKR